MSNLVNKPEDIYISQTFACKQGHLKSTYFSDSVGNYKFKLHLNKNQRSFSNHGELVNCKTGIQALDLALRNHGIFRVGRDL